MEHERGYYITDDERRTGICEKSIVESTVALFNPKTVIDIGCGTGSYTREFIARGVDCMGFDGCPLTPEISGGLCGILDFTYPVDIGKFDVVFSLEVGEHIPKQYEQIFIDNLCNLTNRYIVLSWALEGTIWPGHVNCQNNDYVISEFIKRGFIFDDESTKYIRDHVTGWGHFLSSVMVFVK